MQTATRNLLALDYGERRVGVAIASVVARLPRPLPALPQNPNFWELLTKLIQQEEVSTIIVGLPRGLEGQETAQTALARAFAAKVETKFGLPVYLQDEALTSVKAGIELISRGKQFDKGMVDSLSAVYILDDYLKARANHD
jgi:putative holliday junction resolvase